MKVLLSFFRIIGWLITITVQIIASYLAILLIDSIFSGLGNITRASWLVSLFVDWLGFVIGVNLVGYIALRWIWKVKVAFRQRLIISMVGAIIPLAILLPIGYSLPVGDAGSSFADLVTNTWQPILVQASLFAAIVGYFIPSVLKRSNV